MKTEVVVKGVCHECPRKVKYGTENIVAGILCLPCASFYCTRHFKKHKCKEETEDV